MSKKNQNYTNRKQNRFQPERMRGNVFVNNSGKQWLPGENRRAAKVERLLRGIKEEKKEIAGNMAGYKDSGVEWIGAIPKEWNVSKIGYHLKWFSKKNETDKEVLSVYRELGVVKKNERDDNHNKTPLDLTQYKYVRPGDLVINKMKAWQGSVGVSNFEGIVSPAYFVYEFTSKIINKKYLHHLLRGCYKDEMMRLSGGIRVGQWDLSSYEFERMPIIVPPLPEQQRIADFLDTKCGILDRTIDAVSRQIEDLEKYKKALITKTVTKGICKKGEPERAMKDSGVEWIGEDIPFDWDINRLQFCIDEISERNYAGKETHILSLMKDKGVIPYEEKGRVGNVSKTDLTQYKLAYPNTLITNSMNIIIGSSGISQYKGCVSPAYYVFKAKPNNDIRYFNYIFAVRAFQNECRRFANGILEIRLRISSTNLLKIKVPVPSPEEQHQIADYLDEKCKNIDNRVQKRRQQLEWLKEYKKSLIFDYVTGKKRV